MKRQNVEPGILEVGKRVGLHMTEGITEIARIDVLSFAEPFIYSLENAVLPVSQIHRSRVVAQLLDFFAHTVEPRKLAQFTLNLLEIWQPVFHQNRVIRQRGRDFPRLSELLNQ